MAFVFPNQCALCRGFGAVVQSLCTACVQAMRPIAPLQVTLTATRLMRIFAVTTYEGPILRLIRGKYHNDYIASYELARIIAHKYGKTIAQYDLLVPVPMHWTRQLWRGFNHAERIANELSCLAGVPMLSILQRTRNTRLQQGLSAVEREQNIRNAFSLCNEQKAIVRGKRILLIDDVYTTGSTVRQATRALLLGRPVHIDVMVAVRAI